MIRLILLSFYRNATKHKQFWWFSTFNITIGLSIFMLVFLYLIYELSYDRQFKDYDKIYRIEQAQKMDDRTRLSEVLPPALSIYLRQNYPEILNSTQFSLATNYLSSDNITHIEERGLNIENTFFELFNFKFIKGNKDDFFSKTNSILLTPQTAKKYFGIENPIGKVLRLNNKDDYIVTGIIEEPYKTSHLRQFKYLLPLSKSINNNWTWTNFYCYIKVKDKTNTQLLEKKIRNVLTKNTTTDKNSIYLRRLADLHLKASHVHGPMGENKGNFIMIYIYGGLAILILFFISFNYINSTIANSLTRASEIAIKKINGASKLGLIIQFISESIIFFLLGTMFAFLIVVLFLPVFSNIIGKEIELVNLFANNFIFYIIFMGIIIGTMAGIYPAFVISTYNPLVVLSGQKVRNSKNILKRVLLGFQFFLSVILVVFSIAMYMQITYMTNKDMGFEPKNLLTSRIISIDKSDASLEMLKSELFKIPGVENITVSAGAPFGGIGSEEISYEGKLDDSKVKVFYYEVDADFAKTYNISMENGADFDMKNITANYGKCLINETARKYFGWEDAIGKRIWDKKYVVNGVVKDFHAITLYKRIYPMVLISKKDTLQEGDLISIRINPKQQDRTLKEINTKISNIFPTAIYEFKYLETNIDKVFREAISGVSRTAIFFTIVLIVILIVALFAQVNYSIITKLKMLSIRKVLGASVKSLYLLLTWEYLSIFLFSLIVSIPISIVGINKSFKEFPYTANITGWVYFLIAIALAAVLFISISYNIIKAAKSNPVEFLRNE